MLGEAQPLLCRCVAVQVRKCVRSLGLMVETDVANAIIAQYDADKSGCINLEELAAIVHDLEELMQAHRGGGDAVGRHSLGAAARPPPPSADVRQRSAQSLAPAAAPSAAPPVQAGATQLDC